MVYARRRAVRPRRRVARRAVYRRRRRALRTRRRGGRLALRGPRYTLSWVRPGWPRVTKKQFTYNQSIQLATPAVVDQFVTKQYRANGPQDPEFAIGGDNAYGWDEFTGKLFDRIYCYGCKITVTCAPYGMATAQSIVFGIHVKNNLTSTSTTSLRDYMNQPHQFWRIVPSSAASKTMSRYIDIRKWLPYSSIDDLSSSATGNPTAEVIADLWAADMNQTAPATWGLNCAVRITYYCYLGQTDIIPPSV